MIESHINIRLKKLFDKMYLSRNVFSKMKKMLQMIETGEYSFEVIEERILSFLNSINTIIDGIEELQQYNLKIDSLNDKHQEYLTQYTNLIFTISNYYDTVIDDIMVDIDNTYNQMLNYDPNYAASVVGGIKSYSELIVQNTDNLGLFVPTDDYFAWNSLEYKKNITPANSIVLYANDTDRLDPLNIDSSGYSSNSDIARSPIITDIVVSEQNSGFSLSTINTKTGENYTRIIDDYNPEIYVANSDNYNITEPVVINGITTRKPKPAFVLSINGVESKSISIRRHGETERQSPLELYAIPWKTKVISYNDGYDLSSHGPTAL